MTAFEQFIFDHRSVLITRFADTVRTTTVHLTEAEVEPYTTRVVDLYIHFMFSEKIEVAEQTTTESRNRGVTPEIARTRVDAFFDIVLDELRKAALSTAQVSQMERMVDQSRRYLYVLALRLRSGRPADVPE